MVRGRQRPEPSRPTCMCGSPGAFQVQITVQELSLERYDCRATAHWVPKYRSGTTIDTIMCQSCLRASVQLNVTATARVDKTTKKEADHA